MAVSQWCRPPAAAAGGGTPSCPALLHQRWSLFQSYAGMLHSTVHCSRVLRAASCRWPRVRPVFMVPSPHQPPAAPAHPPSSLSNTRRQLPLPTQQQAYICKRHHERLEPAGDILHEQQTRQGVVVAGPATAASQQGSLSHTGTSCLELGRGRRATDFWTSPRRMEYY